MQFLRSNTACIVEVGPFFGTDGFTRKTALTITNERITLSAATDDGAAPTLVLDNITGATSGTANDLNYITGQDNAMMQLELSAANTNRVGRMRLTVNDATDTNHGPVWEDFYVLPQAVYDWWTGVIGVLSSGTGTGQVKLSGGYVAPNWGDVGNPTTTLNLSGTTIKTVTDLAGLAPIATGTADSGTTSTLVDAARTETDPEAFKYHLLRFKDGTLLGQAVMITGFDPGTDTLEFSPPVSAAVGTHQYDIFSPAAIVNLSDVAISAIQLGRLNVDDLNDLHDAIKLTLGTPAAGSLAADIASLGVIPRNKALPNFMFRLTDVAGNGLPGLSVTAQRSLDGGTMAAFANPVVGHGGGRYTINWAATDNNARVVYYEFSAIGAVTHSNTLITQGPV